MFKATKLNDAQLTSLVALIAEVKEHEERTVVLLGDALPLALNHVWGNENTTMINLLMSVLSPTNKKAAFRFFEVMQAHEWGSTAKDKRVKAFGKRINKKHTMMTKGNMERFFSVDPETNEVDVEGGYCNGDYWLWESHNIKVETKEVDYLGMIGKAIDSAIDDKKGGLSPDEIVKYILSEKGLSIDLFLKSMEPNPVDEEIALLMKQAA